MPQLSDNPTDPLTTIEPTDPQTEQPKAGRRRDWQVAALVAGGVVFSAGNLLHPLEHNDEAYHAPTWTAAHLTIFASLPLLVWGLPALHRRLVTRVGRRLATVSVAAMVMGLIGIAPGTIIETFVAPAIGHHAMHELESGGMGVVNGIFGLAFLGGSLALGWAAHRARLRPRWAGPSIIVGTLAMVAMMGATGPAAGVVIISATAVYGIALAALALAPEPKTAPVDARGLSVNPAVSG